MRGGVELGGYKNSPINILWIWTIRKKLREATRRNSTNSRMQMLKQQDQKSNNGEIEGFISNNSKLQSLITKTQEEAERLKNDIKNEIQL